MHLFAKTRATPVVKVHLWSKCTCGQSAQTQAVLEQDGVGGLFSRGLGATVAREASDFTNPPAPLYPSPDH